MGLGMSLGMGLEMDLGMSLGIGLGMRLVFVLQTRRRCGLFFTQPTSICVPKNHSVQFPYFQFC